MFLIFECLGHLQSACKDCQAKFQSLHTNTKIYARTHMQSNFEYTIQSFEYTIQFSDNDD